MGTVFQFYKMKRVTGMRVDGGGAGHTTSRMCLVLLSCALETVKMVTFVTRILTHY